MTAPIDPTAVIAAAARALETARPNPLVDDPYAARLVDAAGGLQLDRFPQELVDRVRDSNALRSHFLDAVTGDAVVDGVQQVVILGAGLDARPWRLGFAESTTVFRVDLPATVGFTTSVLGPSESAGSPVVVDVAADLREDWPAALLAAGFTSSAATLWIAEGVLFYLEAEDAAAVVSRAAELSAPGSVFTFAHFGPGAAEEGQTGQMATAAGDRGAPFTSTISAPSDLLDGDRWDMLAETTIAAYGVEQDRPLPYPERPGREVTWLAAARRRG